MTASTSRDDFVDEIRGVALLGIAVVNVPFLGLSSAGFTAASVAAPLDRFVAMLVVAFAQAKFYLLFSFLFGYSLSYFVDPDRPESMRALRRRLFGLGAIGVAHAWLFFVGDILFAYAVLGSILPWLARRPDRAVLRVAAIGLVVWLALLAAVVAGASAEPAARRQALAMFEAWDHVFAHGSFMQVAGARMAMWPDVLLLIGVLNGPAVVAMFCIGLVAGRRRLLAHPAAAAALWRRGALLALAVGLPGGLVSAWLSMGPGVDPARPDARQLAGVAIGFVTAPALSWGYLAALAWLHERVPRLLAPFRPAGRMSLSGYVGESVLLSFVFCGYGLGWFAKVGAAPAVAIAVAAWVVLDVLARGWHGVAQRGPMESALRWWTRQAPSRRRA